MISRKILRNLDYVINHTITTIAIGLFLVIMGVLELIENVFVMFESPFQIYQSVILIGATSSIRGIIDFIDGYDKISPKDKA